MNVNIGGNCQEAGSGRPVYFRFLYQFQFISKVRKLFCLLHRLFPLKIFYTFYQLVVYFLCLSRGDVLAVGLLKMGLSLLRNLLPFAFTNWTISPLLITIFKNNFQRTSPTLTTPTNKLNLDACFPPKTDRLNFFIDYDLRL